MEKTRPKSEGSQNYSSRRKYVVSETSPVGLIRVFIVHQIDIPGINPVQVWLNDGLICKGGCRDPFGNCKHTDAVRRYRKSLGEE